MKTEATLGHPREMDLSGNGGGNGATRSRRKSSGRPNFAPPNSRISVQHDRFLRVFRASEDEGGAIGKQITLLTERMDVALGKKPEPGSRAPEVQKMRKVSVRLQASDGHCKEDTDGKCLRLETERQKVMSIQDPALRVFCCPRCNRLTEYEIEAIPHLQLTNVKSIWDDFAVHVAFEQQMDLSSVFAVKTLPTFVHILHSFAEPDSSPIAVSEDMRLMAKIMTGGRDLGLIRSEDGPRIVISLIEKNITLHTIELQVGTAVKSLNFSSDGTMLLATLQRLNGDTLLIIWSMITGKELRRLRGGKDSALLASFSSDSEKVFSIDLSREGKERVVKLEVLFLKTTQDLSDTFRTDKADIGDSVDGIGRLPSFHDKTDSSQWVSGNGTVVVHSSGEYEVHGERGNVVYHFASRAADVSDGVECRKGALSLDHKRFSASKAYSHFKKLVTQLGNSSTPIIRKASISQDGNVFAHVFESESSELVNTVKVQLPSNKTVLVWNLETGELCHRFEHERSVTCVQVSTDGTILLVGVSGYVSAEHMPGMNTRLERSAVKVYSLITREVLWEVPLMHEVRELHLDERDLLFEIDENSESNSNKSLSMSVFAIPTSESTQFPCVSFSDDTTVTELQLLHEVGDNLAVLTADELLAGLQTTTLMSYRSGPGDRDLDGLHSRKTEGSLVASSFFKSITSKESWRSAAIVKRLVGLGVSGDGLSYVAKWAGEGEGGRAVWLSVGDVDWGRGVLVHRENLQLLEAGILENSVPEKIGAFCISNDGDIVVCSIEGTCRVVVIHVPAHDDTANEKILWEFDADVVPKALGVNGEKLSLMGDRDLQVSFSPKETIVLTYSLVTRVLVGKSTHKCSGKTLGIDGNGELRVSMSQEHRVFLERFASGEILYEVFDHNLQFMGISGAGNRIILKDTGHHIAELAPKCPCKMSGLISTKRRGSLGAQKERANHCLTQIDMPNFELFGPSKETCATWMASGEMASMFSVHKSRLSRWMLFDQVLYQAFDGTEKEEAPSCFALWCKAPKPEGRKLHANPGRWSSTVSKLVRDKDYDSINLILEACPVMWACLVYTTKENVVDSSSDSNSNNFLLQALANNDRLLVQLLLDGVKEIVGRGKGVNCPVTQMGQVTEFVIQCLKQSRMTDIVEKFLKELPLIKVDESDIRKHVRSHFRRGRVISTGWTSRDAEALTGPWGLKDTTEEAEEKMMLHHAHSRKHQNRWISSSQNVERGYQYVVALPGLCDQVFLELILSYHASPGLLDNESMRAATRVLEGDLQHRVLGIPIGGHFFAFLVCLACFCCYAEFCVTPVKDDGFTRFSRDEIWETDEGKAGIILGAVSTLFNFIFLLQELQEMFNSRPIWTYIKPWNVIPWLSNLMAIVNFICFIGDSSNYTIRITAGFAMILLWGTLFTFLRSVRKLSALVNMLIQIMNDMLMFILVVAVLLISFAGGLYCLHGKILPEHERPASAALRRRSDDGRWELRSNDEGPPENVFLHIGSSLGRSFVMSVLQTFEVEELASPLEPEKAGALTYVSYLFFFGLVMLVAVVGMNALIAIMNNSFTRVAEREHAVRDKEVASVMLDKLRNFSKKAKMRWQKQRRWVHVLSPSEKGSLVGSGSNTMSEQVKREIHSLETRQETKLDSIAELIREYEEAAAENANMMRDLDSAARIGLQDTGNKQSKLIGMFKKLQDDQGAVHGEVKKLTQTVLALQRRVEEQERTRAVMSGQAPINLAGLENLPWQMKQMQQNQEIGMTQMAGMQREMAKILSQMQSFEWQISGVEQTARTTSAILAPLHAATVEREDRVFRPEDSTQ